MSLTGTRKDPFLSPDSPPLNNISRVQALISLPFFPPVLFAFFLIYLTSSSTLASLSPEERGGGGGGEGRRRKKKEKAQRKCKILIHLSAR